MFGIMSKTTSVEAKTHHNPIVFVHGFGEHNITFIVYKIIYTLKAGIGINFTQSI